MTDKQQLHAPIDTPLNKDLAFSGFIFIIEGKTNLKSIITIPGHHALPR